MLYEIILALIQAATEFLPVSSSGHLAVMANLFANSDISFFTTLHLASLLAVLIFTRKEITLLFSFTAEARKLWKLLIIATIPAALAGFFFHNAITITFASYAFLATGFFITSIMLFATRFAKQTTILQSKNALLIGLFQALALFPGVSRSGMTISTGLLAGLGKEQATKFSFLLFIPLSLGAFVLEFRAFTLTPAIVLAFIACALASFLFLNILQRIINQGKLWYFSFYTLAIAILCLILLIR